ncbi:MAG: chemotaxis protein CheB [Anaerolineales bacterium]|nr:chemotaxis protein CheB [Anaerolineales bacterium]
MQLSDYHLTLSTEPPVSYARPSIDVLFESAAEACGPGVIGVILTGANADGAQGLAVIKARGGLTIVQDPATADAKTMPEAAIAAVGVENSLSLEEIGFYLEAAVSRKR